VNVKENIELLVKVLGERMLFNQLLGLTTDSFDAENACIRLLWQDKLMGNPVHKDLHGGAIASILDVQGAFMVLLHQTNSPTFKDRAWERVEPSDLRIDYLLPGKGRYLIASGSILRIGNKVAVTRMELHNDEQRLIAAGSGTYMLG